jgi:methyl-accepting chemotaxis protein
MSYDMNLRKDQSDITNQSLLYFLVMLSYKNTNNLNNIMVDLKLKEYNGTNLDYTDAIEAIMDSKNKAIIDINNAAITAINQTTEIKQIAQEAKQISQEAKQISQEAKQISQESKQLSDILFDNQNSQYAVLLEKIEEVYNLANEAKITLNDAKQLSIESKQLSTETKQIVDTLTNNRNSDYNDLLSRIDYLFDEFYRSTSSKIIETYGDFRL